MLQPQLPQRLLRCSSCCFAVLPGAWQHPVAREMLQSTHVFEDYSPEDCSHEAAHKKKMRQNTGRVSTARSFRLENDPTFRSFVLPLVSLLLLLLLLLLPLLLLLQQRRGGAAAPGS